MRLEAYSGMCDAGIDNDDEADMDVGQWTDCDSSTDNDNSSNLPNAGLSEADVSAPTSSKPPPSSSKSKPVTFKVMRGPSPPPGTKMPTTQQKRRTKQSKQTQALNVIANIGNAMLHEAIAAREDTWAQRTAGVLLHQTQENTIGRLEAQVLQLTEKVDELQQENWDLDRQNSQLQVRIDWFQLKEEMQNEYACNCGHSRSCSPGQHYSRSHRSLRKKNYQSL
jgi:hypothetical protein